MSAFLITVFHNPRCGTSRDALAMIEAEGYAPTVVEYMKTGWTRPQLDALLEQMGARPRDILRGKEPAAAALGGASDEAILAAMVAEPVLVDRPIVVTPKGARLCRPSETVFEVLDRRPDGPASPG